MFDCHDVDLTQWPLCPSITACYEHWPFFHLWHHYLWPKFASLEFIPRSEWFGQLNMKYAWNCLQIWVKNLEETKNFIISINYTRLCHGNNFLSWWCFSGILKLEWSLVEGQKLCQKDKIKRKRKDPLPEKNTETPNFEVKFEVRFPFVHMQNDNTWC